MSGLCKNTCWKSVTPLVNIGINVDNVLVKITPDPSQPLSQFINALDVCMVNTFVDGRQGKNPAESNLAYFDHKFDSFTSARC